MPNYTKKKHRTFRKKIGGVKKNKGRINSQPQSQWYTTWQGDYGEPGSIAVDLSSFQRQHLNPKTSIAGNEISDGRIINNAFRYLTRVFSRTPTPTPIVETPPSATIVETPHHRRPPSARSSIKKKPRKSETKSETKSRRSKT